MPPLPGFTDNPFRTRADVVTATEALLKPLLQYFSQGCARVRIPVGTGTHFDETAAQLEGFARPLWAIAAFLMCPEEPNWNLMSPWIRGLKTGTNPDHPEYWGTIGDNDQRMVECEMISYCLLAVPKERLWDNFDQETKSNVIAWLKGMHGKEMPRANWLWFRVFANLALLKTCGVDTAEVRASIKNDLEILDTFYITDGWSGDGLWRSQELDEKEWQIHQQEGRAHALPNSRNACYYSGSFAIQFSQLLFVRFAGDYDPERTKRYQQQARDFGAGFWRYFGSDGAAIPFGRSLTYRFACGGFFAALALARVPNMPEPLNSPGSIKGFLLRHLRWWAKYSDEIFYPDGTLNFGWIYPTMYLTEDYNSPQSVYWALKSLIVVGLASQDSFWTEPEDDYPIISASNASVVLPAPRHILCNHPKGNHHFLLSSSQFLAMPFKAAMAKYSKFAYSSAFGFSVPTGSMSLGQIAPDSTLALTRDGGETWAVKYKAGETKFGIAISSDEQVPTATVAWYPWVDRSVEVTTTLIPPTSRWPDWHTRIHRIKGRGNIERLLAAEGGFAIHGRQRRNHQLLPPWQLYQLDQDAEIGHTEGVIASETSVLIMSEKGASGILSEILAPDRVVKMSASALKPDANTNLMVPRSLIPLVESEIPQLPKGSDELVLVTKVFAISSEANGGDMSHTGRLRDRWLDSPVVALGELSPTLPEDAIHLRW